MDFNNNDYTKKIFDDIFGNNETKANINADEVAKPLYELFRGFMKVGFTEAQAMDLVKFMIVSAFKMKQ